MAENFPHHNRAYYSRGRADPTPAGMLDLLNFCLLETSQILTGSKTTFRSISGVSEVVDSIIIILKQFKITRLADAYSNEGFNQEVLTAYHMSIAKLYVLIEAAIIDMREVRGLAKEADELQNEIDWLKVGL